MKKSKLLALIIGLMIAVSMLGGCSTVDNSGEISEGHIEVTTELSKSNGEESNIYQGYAAVVQDIVDRNGVFEEFAPGVYCGLLYGELIDFDDNGTEELLLVYIKNDGSENEGDGFATVEVHGTVDGEVSQLYKAPVHERIMQTDVSYAIDMKKQNDKVIMVVNVEKPECTAPYNEKIHVFTMDNGNVVCDTYYGETLDWWEDFELVYTKCVINDKLVSVAEYESKLNGVYENLQRLYLFPADWAEDDEDSAYISYDKMVNFLDLLEQKSGIRINVM